MKAIYYTEYGDRSVYRYGEQPEPQPGGHDLLVRVRAAGVNPLDWKLRQGELKPTTILHPTVIPGYDLAGVVEAVGPAVTRFKAGDAVFGLVNAKAGAWAEYCVLGEDSAAMKPANLSMEEAAGLPSTALTALQSLRDKGELRAGEAVLINGASGGVGVMAVQIAKALGAAKVIGTAGPEHLDLVKGLGADAALNYHTEDFTQHLDTYDVILNLVPTPGYDQWKPALKYNGRYVTTLPDVKAMIGAALSVFTDKKMRIELVKANADDLEQVRQWAEAGRVKPVVSQVLPLKRAAEASAMGEAGGVAGKIVLTIG